MGRFALAVHLFLLFFLYSVKGCCEDLFSVSAKSCILMNAETGKILYAKNENEKFPPASITKIATCLYALELYGNRLEDTVEATRECIGSISPTAKKRANYTTPAWWLETDASHVGIKTGEKLSLYDLLLALMIASADDAANVIAQYLSGTIPQFVEDLNVYIKEKGLKNTHFMNPHGLHHPLHYTTAADMALLTRSAMQSPEFRKIVLMQQFTRPKTNKQPLAVYAQTNKLVRPGKHYYSKAIGVKTGYHSDAGHTLVAAAESNGRVLIAVLMGVKERSLLFTDVKKLFETAFTTPLFRKTIVKKGAQPFGLKVPKSNKVITPYAEEEVFVEYYANEEPILSYQVKWDLISLPIEKGQKIGNLRVLGEMGTVVRSVPLFAQNGASFTFWQSMGIFPEFSFGIWYKRFFLLCLFTLVVTLLLRAIFVRP